MVGHGDPASAQYNDELLARLRPEGLNVLTIHAEVEGITCLALFREFLQKAAVRKVSLVPLSELLPVAADIPPGTLSVAEISGRQGWLSFQSAGVFS